MMIKVCPNCYEIYEETIWNGNTCPACNTNVEKFHEVPYEIYPILRLLKDYEFNLFTMTPIYTKLEQISVSIAFKYDPELEKIFNYVANNMSNATYGKFGNIATLNIAITPVPSYYKSYIKLIKAIYDAYYLMYKYINRKQKSQPKDKKNA